VLLLRIEVLGELTHDAQDFPLPGLQLGRVLLQKIEDVLFRQIQDLPLFPRPAFRSVRTIVSRPGDGAPPEVVVAFFFVAAASSLALLRPARAATTDRKSVV